MMRFNAAGVQATLSTADLDASLSRSVTLTMGKEQAIDDQRVEAHLAAGNALPTAPIGADGSTKGVLQYLGENEDIPFLMAESREKSEYAVLAPPQPRALRLTVETNDRSHHCRNQTAATDLKIEVFVNGALSDVFYLNPKKTGTTHKYAINGTRIHRQIEKPWIYQPSAALSSSKLNASERWGGASVMLKHEGRTRGSNKWGDFSPSGAFLTALADLTLPERLRDSQHIGLIDVIIVSGKGGKDGPSHGYIARPTRLRNDNYRNDVPLGAGSRPQTPNHMSRPTMSDLQSKGADWDSDARQDSVAEDSSSPLPSKHARSMLRFSNAVGHAHPQHPPVSDDPFTEKCAADESPATAARGPAELPSTSSDVPLATRQQAKSKNKHTTQPQEGKLTTTEAKAKEFADAHGIAFQRDVVIDGIKNRRGKDIGSRTITQRIGDIQKMTPKNQGAAISKLKEELGQRDSDRPGQSSPVGPLRTRSQSSVKHGTPRGPASSTASSTPAPAHLAEQQTFSSITEARTAMALDNGADPGGRLIARIASLSPHPPRTKKQTPLANEESGVSTPISTPRPLQPIQRPETPKAKTPPPSDSVKRSSRKPGKLDDQTPEEALANFKVPDLCKDCTVSFAGGNAQRQIQKTRPGFFDEDEIVVGMRFVVV
ncbi:hypothetical protein CB0940_07652 [Cercospora beticola]|uniref:Uncharacterized protein n=1 Tax=Cercospora beticola TaxID=122368 RepID=A0A2G5H8T9_CERBT|nr:hypothetical protein CB0940_07652 [Cercospora beticola]PIA88947.1 hypothetical protein CB0940_07652 [Cercospora beticola]WPB03618.1 hypothetical protein RHO25_008258 [Cercospora beticola]